MAIGKLTNIVCKNAQYNTEGSGNKLSDGGGLYLELKKNGSKYWRMNYRFLGKQKTLAIGTYPIVGLAEAREKRNEAKKMLADGIDPMAEKRLKKIELKYNHANTFEEIAREWFEQKKHTWKDGHAQVVIKRLEANLFPKLGKRPIKAITAKELLDVLKVIEKRGKTDLAHRQLQHARQIIRYAIATGRAEQNVADHLKDALKPHVTKGLVFLQEKELPGFLKELEIYDSKYNGKALTKLGFQLLIHTFVRSNELRGATWKEFDFEKKQWQIPAERMKIKEPHIVPLSKQALQIVRELYDITGDSYAGLVFPSQVNPRSYISANTFLKMIKVMGYDGKTTAHGFRKVASTILNENCSSQIFNKEHIECQLSHVDRDTIRATYNYAQYIPERTQMMQWWSDYLRKIKN